LDDDWIEELRHTSRPGTADRAAAIVSRALKALSSGDSERAASLAREAKAVAPRSGRVRELLGLASYRSGNWQEALRELLAYRRLTGLLEESHVIADCYRALGHPERALAVCAEISPRAVSPAVWAETVIIAASTLAGQGEVERALAELKKADLEPRQVQDYHLRLWYVLADILERAGRQTEARAVWERIYAEDPDFFDVTDRLRQG
jgi:tetratricopeptide (TPR) repeat protein